MSVGDRVAEITIDYSHDRVTAYEQVIPHYDSIHESPDAAERAGFSQPFASGTMAAAYTIEVLFPELFGEGWTHAGSLNTANIRPILMGSQVTLAADVVAKLPRGEDTLVVMSVNAMLPDGTLVMAGQASALALP